MPITLRQSNQLKAIAILMMLFLHLFNREYTGLFQPLIFVGSQPLSYYISLFCDACVPIFAFVSGYGLYFKYNQNRATYKKENLNRIKKLYINYWIVILLFAVLLGWIVGSDSHPGSLQKLLLNVTAIDTSYNGAWWFFTIYVLFVLTSSFWFGLLERINPYLYIGALLTVYVIAFYFRMYKTDIFSNSVLDYFHRISAMYSFTLFQFMLGAFALKYDWNKKVSLLFAKARINKWLLGGGILTLAIAVHGFIPNLIIAPFTALIFIFTFVQMNFSKGVNLVLDYMASHATNLWLIHMFFYLIYFRAFIYSATYVIPVFLLLVGVCLLSSYVVKGIETPVKRFLNLSVKIQNSK